MTEKSTDLDKFRGLAAQRETEIRRRKRAVVDDQAQLKSRRDEMEKHLFAGPSRDWRDAVGKARYLLVQIGLETTDPRRRTMISSLLEDLERLLDEGKPGD
jgi:hypothetical protein